MLTTSPPFECVNVWHFGTVSNWKFQSKFFSEFHSMKTFHSSIRIRTSETATRTSVCLHIEQFHFAICFLINANGIYVYALNHTVLWAYKVCSTNCYIWHMAKKSVRVNSVDSRLLRRSPLKTLEVSTFWAHFWLSLLISLSNRVW